MVSFKHHFVSAKADGGDSTLVKPSDWNAEHDITTTTDAVVLGVPAGAGAGPVQELPMSSVFPSGVVLPFAGTVIPTGWLLCDGRLLNRGDYPTLFIAIGTAFNIGGEATTQFRIPDIRGRVVAGIDGGTNRINAYVGNAMGAAGGVQQVQPRVYGNVSVSVSAGGTFSGGTDTSGQEVAAAASGTGASFVGHSHGVSVSGTVSGGGSGSISNDGGNVTDAMSNVQPTIEMNQIIKT